jgi:hypothetical protein
MPIARRTAKLFQLCAESGPETYSLLCGWPIRWWWCLVVLGMSVKCWDDSEDAEITNFHDGT